MNMTFQDILNYLNIFYKMESERNEANKKNKNV